jgi:O-antigen/teichoic acid export membrane protein
MERLRNKAYQALKKSERIFKTDMVYLAKGGFWLTLGQVTSTAIGFGLAVAFANLIPSITYGTYQFVLSVSGILSASTLTGLNTAAVRSVARGAEGVISSSLKTKLKWGVSGSLASLLIAAYYFINGDNNLAISFLIVAAFLPSFYSLGIYSSLLKGKKLFATDTKYNITSQLLTSLAVLFALIFTDNLFIVLFFYLASWSVARFVIYIDVIKKVKENDKIDPEILSYGKHLSVMGVIGTISDNLDKLLIFHFIGAVEVAVYSFAIAPVMQLNGLLKNVHTLALPKFSLRSKEEIREMFLSRSFRLLVASLPMVMTYIIAAPYLYKIFFPNYLESVTISQVFSLSLLLAAVGTLSATALESQMEVKRKYILTLFSKVSKIILMLIMVIPYGIWGIVYATLINHFIVVIIGIWLVKRT